MTSDTVRLSDNVFICCIGFVLVCSGALLPSPGGNAGDLERDHRAHDAGLGAPMIDDSVELVNIGASACIDDERHGEVAVSSRE